MGVSVLTLFLFLACSGLYEAMQLVNAFALQCIAFRGHICRSLFSISSPPNILYKDTNQARALTASSNARAMHCQFAFGMLILDE